MRRYLAARLPGSIKDALRELHYRRVDLFDRLTGGSRRLPPEELMFVGGGGFESVGRQFIRYFIELGDLRPDDRVLDVGCGIGRMAVPLTDYLSPRGEYRGFDVVRRGIRWCRTRISRDFRNFHFQHVDVYNKTYNPRGMLRARDFHFPFESACFDFVLATSVFTHMLPADMAHYFAEVSRVLRPGGRCLLTFFLVNEESEAAIRGGHSTLDFKYKLDGCLTTNEDYPEAAVAYDEALVRGLAEHSKLTLVEPIHYGSWCNRPVFLSTQDIVILTKAGTR